MDRRKAIKTMAATVAGTAAAPAEALAAAAGSRPMTFGEWAVAVMGCQPWQGDVIDNLQREIPMVQISSHLGAGNYRAGIKFDPAPPAD